MKQLVKIFMLCFFLSYFILTAYAKDDQAAGTEYLEVSKSVIMAKHEYGANIICLATAEGLYFVDCGMKTELLKRFRQDMEQRFDKKTKALLVSHAHIDHFLAMAAFDDIQVVAAEVGLDLWKKQLAIEFDQKKIEAYGRIFPKFPEAIKTAKPFLPNVWFKDEKILGQGKNRLIFTNTGGHSSCSSSVYFPAEGVLVAGDLVQVEMYPYFGDPTTDMDSWLEAFRKWESLPIKKVCPGHGRVVDIQYIKMMRNYFENMMSVLKKLKRQNLPVKEVVKHPDLPEGYWPKDKTKPIWFDYCIALLYNKITVN